jgi:hypothetical protein
MSTCLEAFECDLVFHLEISLNASGHSELGSAPCWSCFLVTLET